MLIDVIRQAIQAADPLRFRHVPKMQVVSRLGGESAHAPYAYEPTIADPASAAKIDALGEDGRALCRARDVSSRVAFVAGWRDGCA
jgi:hypothetical protein